MEGISNATYLVLPICLCHTSSSQCGPEHTPHSFNSRVGLGMIRTRINLFNFESFAQIGNDFRQERGAAVTYERLWRTKPGKNIVVKCLLWLRMAVRSHRKHTNVGGLTNSDGKRRTLVGNGKYHGTRCADFNRR